MGGGKGKIAFVTTREGTPQIYTMNADGSQQERLFLATGGACQPAWSPDGTKLAYISPCSKREVESYIDTSILIYDLQTGETVTLPSSPGGDFDPSWAPDGQSIVFASRRTGMPLNPYPQIYKINLTDKTLVRLTDTDSTTLARYPAWSSDGQSILYALNRRNIWELWQMSADGQNPVRILLSGGGRNDTHPIWAGTGSLVYFTQTDRGTNAPPRLMQFEIGQELAVNLNAPIPLRDPSLSVDGQLLVAEGTDGENIDIYSFDPITKTLQALTNDPEDDFEPDWQP